MTPSLARMVLAKKTSLLFPLKWFSIPQCWRYERMTRGRRREHYQWNMDLFGVTGIEAEAELLSAIVFAFQQMKLSAQHVGLKINSRKLLNDLMARVNIPPEKWVATCVLVDKLDKVELSDLSKEVDELGVDMQTMEQLVDLLKVNQTICHARYSHVANLLLFYSFRFLSTVENSGRLCRALGCRF